MDTVEIKIVCEVGIKIVYGVGIKIVCGAGLTKDRVSQNGHNNHHPELLSAMTINPTIFRWCPINLINQFFDHQWRIINEINESVER